MAELKTYSADRVNITVGAHNVTGYADGTFVEIEPQGDGVTSVSGADGEVARAMSLDPRHRITLTLMQTSASNTVLSALADADRASGGDGAFPVTVADLRGATLFGGTGWVVSKPSTAFADTADQTREWVLEAVGQFVSGGAL